MRYKLMNDYGADWPFWGGVEGAGLCADNDPALPADLATRLRTWTADFNRLFDYQYGWPNEATARAHQIEGDRLYRAVRAALPNASVTFDYWETSHRGR